MNQLSLFIYLSDILGNFQVAFSLVGWFTLIVLCIWTCGRIFDEDMRDATKPVRGYLWAVTFLTILSSLAMPTKSTMQLIAASEFGERVINSERVQGIVDPGLKYVEKWLKDQLTEKKKD